MYQFFLTLSDASGKFCETQNNLQKELNLGMADHKSKADFDAMSGQSLKNIYKNRGFQRADTWKPR